MPPKKTTKTAAAGSATARKTATNLTAAQKRTVAKKPHFKAKFVRMNELRARYRAVGLALKPALTEIANRTTYEIKNDTHYNHQGIKEVEAQLEEVRDRAIANISAQTALRMEAVQRKTEYDMWLVQQERKVFCAKNDKFGTS